MGLQADVALSWTGFSHGSSDWHHECHEVAEYGNADLILAACRQLPFAASRWPNSFTHCILVSTLLPKWQLIRYRQMVRLEAA
jgi:hypothetical protein